MKSTVEFEVERDGQSLTVSIRAESSNLVLTVPIDSASVISATLVRATSEDVHEQTFRFKTSGELTGKTKS